MSAVLQVLLLMPATSAQVEVWAVRIPHLPTATLKTDNYIIGGRSVTIEEFPHQCSLRFREEGSHTCGCTLVHRMAILTAAHCVSQHPTSYNIRYGSTFRTSGGDVTNLAGVTRHPDYVQDGNIGFPNDVAVIRTFGIDESPTVQFIDMPDPSDGDFAGDICEISGWGRTVAGGGGTLPNMLVAAETTVWQTATCQGRWAQVDGAIHVCVGGVNNEGSCNGDSGGPLTCDIDGRKVVTGLTSWGRAGCLTNYPSVYVRVSTFKEWIEAQIGSFE